MLPAECSPLFEPTFEEIFDRTFKPTCGVAGGSCHAVEGAQANLVFDEPDASYTRLLAPDDADPRVVSGDAECSPLVVRLEASGGDQMPPGRPLGAAERCAIIEWIRAGAVR